MNCLASSRDLAGDGGAAISSPSSQSVAAATGDEFEDDFDDFDEEDFDDDFDDDFAEEDDFEDDLPDEMEEEDLKKI